jgi:4-diphosphocytidyl-2-C-methyl-D-erythritol kinase
VRSLMQALDLADTLHFSAADDLTITSDDPAWDGSRSLVARAVEALRGAAGVTHGAEIKIEKRIPLLAGLGGDSSDAAQALLGLNQLWGLEVTPRRLYQIALGLGSDVPFFLAGGTMLARGRGEDITPLTPLTRTSLVLLLPDVPVETGKTARAYGYLKPEHFTRGEYTYRAVGEVNRSHTFDPAHGYNAFDNVIAELYPGLEKCVSDFVEAGAEGIHLAGSGPALFAVTADAAAVRERLAANGYRALTADTTAGFGADGILIYNDTK